MGTFFFHTSETRKSRSLVQCSMAAWGNQRWRNNGIWISNSEQTEKTVLENGSVFTDILQNTRITSFSSRRHRNIHIQDSGLLIVLLVWDLAYLTSGIHMRAKQTLLPKL